MTFYVTGGMLSEVSLTGIDRIIPLFLKKGDRILPFLTPPSFF